jgi:hypothetical protein
MRALLIMTAVVAFAPGATIPVPASPSAIAVGGGSVWALAGSRLVEINPRTNRVTAPIDVGVRVGSERTCDLAVAGGLVWTIGTQNNSRSLVVRVDAATGRPLGSTSLPSAACVAATPTGAWVTLPDARALVQLNRRGRVLRRVPTDAYCDAIVAGHGALWTAYPKETAGAPIGRHTGTILRITNQGKLTVAAHNVFAGALAAGPAGVFATGVNHDSGTTVRVDTPGARFLGSGAITVGEDSLWVVDWRGPGRPGYLRERDAHSGRLLRTFRAGFSPIGVALGEGAVWVTDYTQPGSVTRVVP